MLFTAAGRLQAYALMYAKQNPFLAMFAPLDVVGVDLDEDDAERELDSYVEVDRECEYEFRLRLGSFVSDKEIELAEDTEIVVLPQLFFKEGVRMASHASLFPLDHVLLDPGGRQDALRACSRQGQVSSHNRFDVVGRPPLAR